MVILQSESNITRNQTRWNHRQFGWCNDIFVQELQTKGGYQIVDEPGPDVLRVTAGIFKLYINAPDTLKAPATCATRTLS